MSLPGRFFRRVLLSIRCLPGFPFCCFAVSPASLALSLVLYRWSATVFGHATCAQHACTCTGVAHDACNWARFLVRRVSQQDEISLVFYMKRVTWFYHGGKEVASVEALIFERLFPVSLYCIVASLLSSVFHFFLFFLVSSSVSLSLSLSPFLVFTRVEAARVGFHSEKRETTSKRLARPRETNRVFEIVDIGGFNCCLFPP